MQEVSPGSTEDIDKLHSVADDLAEVANSAQKQE